MTAGRYRNTILALVLMLAGCAGSGYRASLEDRGGIPARRIPVHTVVRGDTLFSIAWSHGMDLQELAKANNLRPPYTIYPGQKLYLGRAAAVAAARRGADSRRAGGTFADRRGTAARGGQNAGAGNRSEGDDGIAAAPLGPWCWPARGAVVQGFGAASGGSKGIDIQGQLGEPVYAANSGKVVYAGSGLPGYGNLLIIRHNEQYLSAYAHNSRLLAREGETVKAGDRIAEIGDSGTDSIRLHFEIRRNGTPVDPLGLLPRR